MLYLAKIEIEFKRDWTRELTKKFDIELDSIYFQPLLDSKVLDIIKIPSRKISQEDCLNIFEEYDSILEYVLLDKTDENYFFKVITLCDTNIDKLSKNNCFQLDNLHISKGKEYWEVVSNDKKNFKQLLLDLNTSEKSAFLRSITNYNFDKKFLTQKQYDILVVLFEKGYFEIPKRITLDELSKDLKLSKSTIGVHLQKIESALIRNFLNK